MKLGIIGIGNMGEAILQGVLQKQVLSPQDIGIYDVNEQKARQMAQQLGVTAFDSAISLIQSVPAVLLAVKPNVCASVLTDTTSAFAQKALLSIVTGWSRKRLAAYLPEDTRILRVMPNTPCLVGEGMLVFDEDHSLTNAEMAFATEIFSAIGVVESVPSHLMNAVTGVSGSGPAYVYLFIEAMADAGVRAGLPRQLAYRLAAQTTLGSAKTVLHTGTHPGVLKDAVCSPGGTTIEAVAKLEENGFRHAVMDAIDACVKKSEQLSAE